MNGSRQVPVSAMLQDFLETLKEGPMTLQDFFSQFPHQVIAFMMLLVSLPSAIPHGIPGLSSVFSVPLFLLSIPLMTGSKKIHMPKWMGALSFQEETLARILKVCIPVLQKAEAFLRPRAFWAVSPWMERLIGAVILGLAFILFLPIPFGNVPPALCVCLLSLGLLTKDGIMVLVGMALSMGVIGFLAGAVMLVLQMMV